MKNNLSLVISAYNEEKKIEECIKSGLFADEIIVVDGSSTDKTVEVVKKYTSNIFIQPNNSMLNVNKNFGFLKAKGDWILNLDADERVSPELKDKIIEIISKDDIKTNGFWIPRKNIIFGKLICHTGWYPDYQLRLFKKGKGRFPEKHVHEMIKIEGGEDYLKEHIIHHNYQTISRFIYKMDIYSSNESEQLTVNNYVFKWKDALIFPFEEFISRFFAREGYKDGFHGLMLSILMAFYRFIIFAKIWEKEKFKDLEINNLLPEVEKELKIMRKKTKFWFVNEKLKKINNPIRRKIHQLVEKFNLY